MPQQMPADVRAFRMEECMPVLHPVPADSTGDVDSSHVKFAFDNSDARDKHLHMMSLTVPCSVRPPCRNTSTDACESVVVDLPYGLGISGDYAPPLVP